MENTTFEQKLIIAIENIKDNPSESNSKILKNLFNKGFSPIKQLYSKCFQVIY